MFFDEGNRFLVTKEFAELVQRSNNYFVIATREKLPMLPYSVNEIYGFRKSGKYQNMKQTYNEVYHLYGEISEENPIHPEMVITEDSNSGYEFFSELVKPKGMECISANGKSNIINKLKSTENVKGRRLVIVDGAAIGSEMRDIYEYIDNVDDTVLYAPESFEWLLLSANIIPNMNVLEILQNPEKYIESEKYVSWERYFTALLIEKTQKNLLWAYSKKKISKMYLSSKVMNAVKKIMKLIIWD